MITLEINGPVATVTLCRAPVNAINDQWLERFDEILDAVESDQDLSILHIRSSEKAFAAGADLALMRSRFAAAEGRQDMVRTARHMQDVFARIECLPLVTVAQIGGAALGGGFELALACDLRIVSESTKIGLPEAGLGLLPGAGGTQRLTRLCGDAIARRLILTAEVVPGRTAVELGMAQWAVPSDQLQDFTKGLIDKMAQIPKEAIAECKLCIDSALQSDMDGFETELEGTLRLYENPKSQEMVRRFLDKSG